jgi:hypothetical protein
VAQDEDPFVGHLPGGGAVVVDGRDVHGARRGEAALREARGGALGGAAAVVGDEDLVAQRRGRPLGHEQHGPDAPAQDLSRVSGSSLSVWKRKLASRPTTVRSCAVIFSRMLDAGRPTTSNVRAAISSSRSAARRARSSRGLLARVGDERLVALVLVRGAADADGRSRADVGLVDDREAASWRPAPWRGHRDARGRLAAGRPSRQTRMSLIISKKAGARPAPLALASRAPANGVALTV